MTLPMIEGGHLEWCFNGSLPDERWGRLSEGFTDLRSNVSPFYIPRGGPQERTGKGIRGERNDDPLRGSKVGTCLVGLRANF